MAEMSNIDIANTNDLLHRRIEQYLIYLVVLIIPFALGILSSFEPNLILLAVLLGVLWIVCLVGTIIATIVALARKNMRSALWRGALVLTFLVALLLLRAGGYVGWIGRLLVHSSYYEAQVNQIDGPIVERLKLFSWGGYLIFNDIFLAYDGSDSLLIPEMDETEAFRTKLAAEIPNTHWDATHLWGHYYVLNVHG